MTILYFFPAFPPKALHAFQRPLTAIEVDRPAVVLELV
jgi:hypothetical protein